MADSKILIATAAIAVIAIIYSRRKRAHKVGVRSNELLVTLQIKNLTNDTILFKTVGRNIVIGPRAVHVYNVNPGQAYVLEDNQNNILSIILPMGNKSFSYWGAGVGQPGFKYNQWFTALSDNNYITELSDYIQQT